MNRNDVTTIKFFDVTWPLGSNQPNIFKKTIRGEFLLDTNGNVFSKKDLKDILMAYLQDEFDECPTSLDFLVDV